MAENIAWLYCLLGKINCLIPQLWSVKLLISTLTISFYDSLPQQLKMWLIIITIMQSIYKCEILI